MNFIDMILMHGRLIPHHPAVVTVNRVVAYGALAQGILKAEEFFCQKGVRKGALVGVSVVDPVRHLVALCALYRLGAPSISLRRADMARAVDYNCAAIIGDEQGSTLPIKHIPFGGSAFSGPDANLFAAKPCAMQMDDPARIILSSGSTGKPKGIWFTAGDLEVRNIGYMARLAGTSWSRMMSPLGFSTNFGFSFAISTLWLGHALFLPMTAEEAMHLTLIYKIDNMVMSPTQLIEFADEYAKTPVAASQIKAIHVGGSLLTQRMLAHVRTNVANNVICAYGSTEAGTVAFAPAAQLPAIDGASGFVTPWTRVEICDPAGNVLKADEVGVVRIKADGQGKTFDPQNPFAAVAEEWFYPGDLGRLSRQGLLTITGRESELINLGGVKLAPDTIEDMFRQFPGVLDVGALAVDGERGISELWVGVTLSGKVTATQIRASFEKAHPDYPLARLESFAAIPKTESGKIDRVALKDMLMNKRSISYKM